MGNEPGGLEIPAWVLEQLRRELPKRFTGKIELNFYEGGVGNINVGWSRKAPNGGQVRSG